MKSSIRRSSLSSGLSSPLIFPCSSQLAQRFSPSKVALLRVIFSMSAPHCLESRLPDLRRFSKSALILAKHWVFCENRRGKPLGPAKSGPLPYARLRRRPLALIEPIVVPETELDGWEDRRPAL